jgi:ABC-type glycerol-3-phosphate transport system substrate-binding protein
MILLQKKYPDREFLVTAYDSWDMLPLLMSANLSEFVDLNTFQCNFDSEIFKKTLELSKLYQTTKEYYSSSETLEQLIADEIVLFSESFDSINDFVRTKEDAMEEQLTYIGYPTTDGSIGANIRGESGMYGISANSQNKDGAWAFIEFGLEESLDPDPQKIGAKLPALQGWLDVIILGALLSDTHDIELDDVEFIRTVIREAKPIMPVADFSVAMESTIQSEAEYFYTGVYSVDQTADNIQNKAQKLMDEIRAK